MVHTALVGVGLLVMLVALAGFFASFWRREPPKADNSSRSDWAALTGGGYQGHQGSGPHHSGDH